MGTNIGRCYCACYVDDESSPKSELPEEIKDTLFSACTNPLKEMRNQFQLNLQHFPWKIAKQKGKKWRVPGVSGEFLIHEQYREEELHRAALYSAFSKKKLDHLLKDCWSVVRTKMKPRSKPQVMAHCKRLVNDAMDEELMAPKFWPNDKRGSDSSTVRPIQSKTGDNTDLRSSRLNNEQFIYGNLSMINEERLSEIQRSEVNIQRDISASRSGSMARLSPPPPTFVSRAEAGTGDLSPMHSRSRQSSLSRSPETRSPRLPSDRRSDRNQNLLFERASQHRVLRRGSSPYNQTRDGDLPPIMERQSPRDPESRMIDRSQSEEVLSTSETWEGKLHQSEDRNSGKKRSGSMLRLIFGHQKSTVVPDQDQSSPQSRVDQSTPQSRVTNSRLSVGNITINTEQDTE